MSTSDASGGQRSPSGEGTPLTRRELKARGVSFTTEIPAVDPLEWVGGASAASHAARTEHDRVEAGRAVTEGAGSGGVGGQVASPGDRNVAAEHGAAQHGAAQHGAAEHGAAEDGAEDGAGEDGAAEDGAAEDGAGEDGNASTGAARRPVVRAPLTATGIRTVDESGTITSVQAAVGRAVKAATSPASWESAVSMPAVALGIPDDLGRPAQSASGAGDGGPPSRPEEGAPGARQPEPATPAPTTSEPTTPEPTTPEPTKPAPTGWAPTKPAPAAWAPATAAPAKPARRRMSRPLAITLGVVLVVLITVVLLLTLLSGGASASGAGPALSTGGGGGALGTLAVALGVLPASATHLATRLHRGVL